MVNSDLRLLTLSNFNIFEYKAYFTGSYEAKSGQKLGYWQNLIHSFATMANN